jgi:alkylhydroperoxidase family enzyme
VDSVPAVGRKSNAVSDEEVKAVAHFYDSDLFSARDKAALEFAEATTRTPVKVSDEVFENLRKFFNDDQIVELTASIAFENYRARFNHALNIGSANLYE